MEQILEAGRLEEAVSGSMDLISRVLNSEASAFWVLDPIRTG